MNWGQGITPSPGAASGRLAAGQHPQKLDLSLYQVGGDPGGPLLRVGAEVIRLGIPKRVNAGREVSIHEIAATGPEAARPLRQSPRPTPGAASVEQDVVEPRSDVLAGAQV